MAVAQIWVHVVTGLQLYNSHHLGGHIDVNPGHSSYLDRANEESVFNIGFEKCARLCLNVVAKRLIGCIVEGLPVLCTNLSLFGLELLRSMHV